MVCLLGRRSISSTIEQVAQLSVHLGLAEALVGYLSDLCCLGETISRLNKSSELRIGLAEQRQRPRYPRDASSSTFQRQPFRQ